MVKMPKRNPNNYSSLLIKMKHEIKKSMWDRAELEGKSLTQYIIDLHITHVGRLVECPKCSTLNIRPLITCKCGEKI